jgi:hypothetical protein
VGISCALKNHFGTLGNPMSFHGDKFKRSVSELNALPPIKVRTRLIVGDVLTTSTIGDGYGYNILNTGKATLLMSFDPVAHDAVGLQMAREALPGEGRNPASTVALTSPWLATAAELGVGTNNLDQIELREVDLS